MPKGSVIGYLELMGVKPSVDGNEKLSGSTSTAKFSKENML